MVTVKNLETRRNLLQNVASQRPGVIADLAGIDATIERLGAELETLKADREPLVTKLAACDQAKAELPELKRELAEAIEADQQRQAAKSRIKK